MPRYDEIEEERFQKARRQFQRSGCALGLVDIVLEGLDDFSVSREGFEEIIRKMDQTLREVLRDLKEKGD